MLLGTVVDGVPHSVVGSGRTVLVSTCCVAAMSPMSMGLADQSRATTPARCGAAMEVPLSSLTLPSGQVEGIFTPGALRSGLMRPSSVGPREENEAMLSWLSVAPTSKLLA